MGSWLFGSPNQSVNSPQPPASGLRIQSSLEGMVRPLVWGLVRLACNLIWYGDFEAHPVFTSQGSGSGGGKGGDGGSNAGSVNVSYTYSASLALGLCEGPILGVESMWANKANGPNTFTIFLGAYDQSPWGYLVSAHPTEALAYRGLAYLAAPNYDLADQTSIPNFTFEVQGVISDAVAGLPDADPRDWVIDFLTNAHYGAGFPSSRLDLVMTQYSNYAKATGLLISLALTDQTEASSTLATVLQATNSSARWSDGKLTIVPWGDAAVTGNGVTYVPNVTPIYDITSDDLLPNQGADDQAPVAVKHFRKSDMLNQVLVEYLNRANEYNPRVLDAKDQASIDIYGKRPSDTRQLHCFALGDAAILSASLMLNREQIPNEYMITLPPKFILPDVEDILTLTRAEMGLARAGVRIKEIKENQDGSLTFTLEDFMGTSSAPVYGAEAGVGYVPNTNIDPGDINMPMIFEPTAELMGGATLQVWGAISGVDLGVWGGCNVYASYDNENFALQGTIRGPSRMGALTAPLPSVAENPTGQTIDQTSTLSVDLTESGGQLLSGTDADVIGLNTVCYVDGEYVAYRDADLTSTYNYNLTYLVRGAFGTESLIGLHPTGSKFARLDQGIFKVPYDQNRIGSTVYFKFQSFNVWGGGQQDLSALPIYPYVITGSALTSPLSTVQSVRTEFTDLFEFIYWDDVVDFRTAIRYQIFKGDTFAGAQQVGDNAHAPFVAFGIGTYWIRAYAQPVPGLYVYSESPASITISGNMIVSNLVYQSDQQAAGWLGTFSNGVGRDGVNIRLGGAGNILTDSDFLHTADILNYGGIIDSGTYTIPSTDVVDVGYTANCYVNASWIGAGAPADQNVLAMTDFLNQPDILGAASTQYINVKVQIRTAVGDVGDLYAEGDLYGSGDLYIAGLAWGDWKDYVPGVYVARWVDFRLLLTSIDPNTVALALAFSFAVSVVPRIDHYPPQTVPAGGLTITFEPDNASTAAPFNGGPPVGGTVHNQPMPIYQITAPNSAGLSPVIDAFTLAAITFHFENGSGTHVTVPNVSVVIEGY